MATMIPPRPRRVSGEKIYPESDGKRIADSILQLQWMTRIMDNLTDGCHDDANVLVAMDLLWYPVEGDPKITLAPDVMVIFGRPKFLRGSYKQWEEGDIAPQVVFEIVSESNTIGEMIAKSAFLQRYGVEEFYLYDPDGGGLDVILYSADGLKSFPVEDEWVSPRLGVRFVPQPRAPMEMYLPDGKPFRTLSEERQSLEYQTELTRKERERAEAERIRADAAQAERDAERLARERRDAELRELGIDPNTL